MADDFEKAVLISFNYGGNIDPQLKVCIDFIASPAVLEASSNVTSVFFSQERAAAYIASIKQSAECWKLCVERFSSTPYSEVKFWCLQTLHEVQAHSCSPCSQQIDHVQHLIIHCCTYAGSQCLLLAAG